MLFLYASTIFMSAFLLFLIQPIVGKMLLPLYGGAPAVWNTCMMFFQAVLLLGYAYVHLSIKWLGTLRQAKYHMVLMAITVAVLPITIAYSTTPPADANPVLLLLGRLIASVALPFFVISSSAPMLQSWFSKTNDPSSSDPYFLYSASNVGSLLALLGYPVIFEPLMGIVEQNRVWSYGYGLLIVMTLSCLIFLGRRRCVEDNQDSNSIAVEPAQQLRNPSGRQRAFWVLTSFIPSSMMLSVTTYITTNLAAIPLLWVLPLALYLVTFILVFARRQVLPHDFMVRIMPFVIIPLSPLFFFSISKLELLLIPAHLLMFFVAAMVCHGELAKSRPNSKYLTEFYFLMSIGGVLGGVFNTLVAPVVFNRVVEYPITMFLACLMLPVVKLKQDTFSEKLLDVFLPLLLAGFVCAIFIGSQMMELSNGLTLLAFFFVPVAVCCFSFKTRPIRFALAFGVVLLSLGYFTDMYKGNQLYASRNFFGVKRVVANPARGIRFLYHGTTVHGSQFLDPTYQKLPLSYYHPTGPIGDVFAAYNRADLIQPVAIVGLGTGSISSYATPQDHFVFYEIDPDIEQIARNARYFNFLSGMKGSFEVVLGDARLALANAHAHEYGMIILDAFSSDAIPVHLLTKEALELYLTKIKTNGVLVFHISNRFLDLEPLMGCLAKKLGLFCLIRKDVSIKQEDKYAGKTPSVYVVMGRKGPVVNQLIHNAEWNKVTVRQKIPIWTDKYSNLIDLLKW
jgi:hypothetical protein